jgi:hypothetical protein
MVNIPFWPFKKKKKPLSRERFLGSRPVLNPTVKTEESEEGVITLVVPVDRSGLPMLFGKGLSLPKERKIQLDEIGTKVWKKIDGSMTMAELSKWMADEFKVTQREAEVSLGIYLDKLIEKGLVGVIVPPPKPGTPEAAEEAKELRRRSKELEDSHRKGKITEQQLKEAQQQIAKMLEEMGEQGAKASSA